MAVTFAQFVQLCRDYFGDSTDPVKHCDVYRDKAAGSCAHVDGFLCDFPSCSMLKEYREKQTASGEWLCEKQHPTLPEVSSFRTTYKNVADEYARLGWTVSRTQTMRPERGNHTAADRLSDAAKDAEGVEGGCDDGR